MPTSAPVSTTGPVVLHGLTGKGDAEVVAGGIAGTPGAILFQSLEIAQIATSLVAASLTPDHDVEWHSCNAIDPGSWDLKIAVVSFSLSDRMSLMVRTL